MQGIWLAVKLTAFPHDPFVVMLEKILLETSQPGVTKFVVQAFSSVFSQKADASRDRIGKFDSI